jgi:serine protease Do
MNGDRQPTASVLRRHRVALLATAIVGLAAGALLMAPGTAPYAPPALAQNLSEEAKNLASPTGFADVVDKVKPAVISVRTKMDAGPRFADGDELPLPKGAPLERFFRRFGGPESLPGVPRGRRFGAAQGSGFLISEDGYAVTNNHVVEHASAVEVTTDDGKNHNAKVVGTDARTDLALIKIEGGRFPYVRLADTPPRVGDWVLAVGNPFGLGGTVTAGIVSARGRDIGAGPYDDFLQIDAPVNKGNSGGPTFNAQGSVIGVNTAIFSPSGGSVGIAFAIPAETVKSVVAQLKEKGSVTRGWIGVQIQPVTPEIADGLGLKSQTGALVAEPQKDGPAVKAGIEAGDVIASLDDKAVSNARDLARKIGGMPPGAKVRLGIVRKGEQKTITVTLGELPNVREARAEQELPGRDGDFDGPHFGMSLAPAGREPGVVVAEVDPASPAADFGFKPGDIILEIGGKTVATPSDVRRALGKARSDGKRSVLMRVKTDQGTRYMAIPLGRG